MDKISDLSNLSSSKSKQTYHQRSTKLNFLHNEQKTVEDIIFRATGMTSKQLASECLQFGETFSSKPWLRQFDIALHSSRNRIQRGRPRTSIPESQWHDSTSFWKEVHILFYAQWAILQQDLAFLRVDDMILRVFERKCVFYSTPSERLCNKTKS